MSVISNTEAADRDRLEGIITRGRKTFIAVGQALSEIRSRKLYRASHSTFAAYVKDRFSFSPQHAGRICKAAEVAPLLEPIGSSSVTESQVREVSKAAPEHRKAVVDRAVEIAAERGKETTAAILAEARREIESVDDTPPLNRSLKRRTAKSKPNQHVVEQVVEPNRIGDLIAIVKREFQPFEWRVIAERLLDATDATVDVGVTE